MGLHITGFIVCAAVIFFAGSKLSFYGDLLAEKTGMGKAWIGLILIAWDSFLIFLIYILNLVLLYRFSKP